MSAPPGNRNAAPAAYRRLVSSLPSHVAESWDWRARCEWQLSFWKRVMPRGMTFVKALQQRLKLMDTARPFAHRCFDLGAARLQREVKYATKQAVITSEVIKDYARADSRLFRFTQAFFKTEGFPSNPAHDLDVLAPLLKKSERQMRHCVGFIVPFQQKEAFCFSASGLTETCIRVPSWFADFEVHYGFHEETPPIASYRGSALMLDEQSPEWQIFLTEWAALVAYELMYQARQGRLHFVSTSNRAIIREIGLNTLMFGRCDLATQLETLIDEIDVIRWSEVSPQNRALLDHAGDTHVSITGNWVAFNAEASESQMETDMYLVPEEWGHVAFDYPGGSLTGFIDRRVEEKRTTRHVRSGDEGGVPPKYQLLELEAPAGKVVQETPDALEEARFRFPNEKAQRRLARALDQLMVRAGVKPLITEYGYPDGSALDTVVDIVRLHLGTCVNRGSAAEQRAKIRSGAPLGSPSVKTEGLSVRSGMSIREQLDMEEKRKLQAKEEAAVGKAEGLPLPPTPAIAPQAYLKPAAKEPSHKSADSSKGAGAASNRRLDIEVVNLLSDDDNAVMTDVES